MLARDVVAYGDVLADGFCWEDRRSGLYSTHGKREEIEQVPVVAQLGLDSVDTEVLEVRGDRVSLCRQTCHIAGGYEVVLLVITRVDGDGAAVASVLFDDRDLDAARAELDIQSARAYE